MSFFIEEFKNNYDYFIFINTNSKIKFEFPSKEMFEIAENGIYCFEKFKYGSSVFVHKKFIIQYLRFLNESYSNLEIINEFSNMKSHRYNNTFNHDNFFKFAIYKHGIQYKEVKNINVFNENDNFIIEEVNKNYELWNMNFKWEYIDGNFILNNNQLFDWLFYVNENLDLQDLKINTKIKALEHFLDYGFKEGRFFNFENKNRKLENKCIFMCVFGKLKYVEMSYLLLESLFIYGNLDENTEVLIYTSTEYMNLIKESNLYCENKIKFEINDLYKTVEECCFSRLDIFKLKSSLNYDKILYIDTDILIKDDINKVFNICNNDILYVLEEGAINHDGEFWGKTLFGNELHNYEDKTAFTSGIILFKNSSQIKILFNKIIDHFKNFKYNGSFYDQPYIVYNSFKYKMYNNKLMKEFCINNDTNIHSNKVIHHFPGGPEYTPVKIQTMRNFLNSIKDFTISSNIQKTTKIVNEILIPIVHHCGEPLEGNIFTVHLRTDQNNSVPATNKRKNISNLVLNLNITNVMEIGFNAGFSTLLMLISNPRLHIDCFDLGEHRYTMPCYLKLKEIFGNRLKLKIGNSVEILANHQSKYDLIHIDGGHSVEVASSDIENCYRFSNKGTILIFDDYDFPHLHTLWDKYINNLNLKNLVTNVYECPLHDAKYVS